VGLFTTLINVCTVQGGHFSSTAKMTIVVTAVLTGCMCALLSVYRYILEGIKVPEDRIVAHHG
jgi:hypothetical protein